MSQDQSQEKAGILSIEKPYSLNGNLYHTNKYKNVSDFVKRDDTPGNVGICLSGGGSVAMMSALGQLRALNAMGYLSKAKALSTVSGGSWAAIPFTYLPDSISDDDFLNKYVPNPSDLTLDSTPSPTSLNYLPTGNMGQVVASDGMDWKNLAKEALKLFLLPTFDNNKIWTYLIGKHVLKPFGLSPFKWGIIQQPSFFAHTSEDAKNIKSKNPGLPDHYYYYQISEGRIKRPFHLCNGAMFITPQDPVPGMNQLMAPLQSNAFGTGILGDTLGYYTDGKEVGNGLVSSYAFNSKVDEAKNDNVKVWQSSAFSLSDITGTSSAFFATLFKEITAKIDPRFSYWSVKDPQHDDGTDCNFGDGGTIDNSGIANLLAYNDIDSIVYFSNALQTVYKDVSNTDSNNIVVDLWIPPLFGYTPYGVPKGSKKKPGYVLYKEVPNDELKDYYPYYKNNQVFDSSHFEKICKGLYDASDNYSKPAAYYQEGLEVKENNWFAVSGGKKINVLWVHYNPVMEWQNQLQTEVINSLNDYANETYDIRKKYPDLYPPTPTDNMFPNFVLLQTQMPMHIINLFANQTSWIAGQQNEILSKMFK